MITMLRDRTLLGLIFSVLLMMTGVGIIVTVLPQQVLALEGSGQSVGYLASAFAFSFILLQIPIGSLADKLGFKLFISIGYFLCSLAGLAYFVATSSGLLFFARLLQGMGEAPVWALAPALLSQSFPLNKGKAIGLYNAAIHLGLTLGPVLGMLLAPLLNGNKIFLVYSFCCLAGTLVNSFLVKPVEKKEIQIDSSFKFGNIFALLRQKHVSIILIGITLYGTGYGTFLTAIPAFLLQEKAYSPVDLGIFFSMFYVSISLSQIITGPLSDRFGRDIFMTAGLLVMGVGIIMAPFLDTPLILFALTIASFGMGIFYIASMGFLNEIVPDDSKGTISGAYYLFWGVGMFFGPPLISEVTAYTNFPTAIKGYAFLILLVAVGLLTNKGTRCQQKATKSD